MAWPPALFGDRPRSGDCLLRKLDNSTVLAVPFWSGCSCLLRTPNDPGEAKTIMAKKNSGPRSAGKPGGRSDWTCYAVGKSSAEWPPRVIPRVDEAVYRIEHPGYRWRAVVSIIEVPVWRMIVLSDYELRSRFGPAGVDYWRRAAPAFKLGCDRGWLGPWVINLRPVLVAAGADPDKVSFRDTARLMRLWGVPWRIASEFAFTALNPASKVPLL